MKKKGSLDKDVDKESHDRSTGSIKERPVSVVSLFSERNRELFSDPQVAEALDNIIEKNRPSPPANRCEPLLRRMISSIKARIAARFRSQSTGSDSPVQAKEDDKEPSNRCTLTR